MRRQTFLAALAAAAAIPRFARAAASEIWVGSYAHLDPEWRWPLQEGLQQADSTFQSVMRVLEAYPQLRFSETSASLYAWVKQTDAETFDRVAQLVRAGRWEIAGGWWTEPDVNIVSGESLMRQAWYGQRFFNQAFGMQASVAMLPDSFGASANLPAILAAQGFRYYISGRGTIEGTVPSGIFRWQSLGDASVVAYANTVPGGTDDAIGTIRGAGDLDLGYSPLVWIGLGDHGGGPTLEQMKRLDDYLAQTPSVRLRFCRFEEYFAQARAPRAHHAGEFAGVFPGAFTNAHAMKRANVEAERALLELERFDVLASQLGIEAPPPDLESAWHTVLTHQHHDTISGTTLPESLAAAVDDLRAVSASARAQTTTVLERIVDRIPHAAGDDAMLVAFNPLEIPVDAVLSYPLHAGPERLPLLFEASGKAAISQPSFSDDRLYSGAATPTLFRVAIPPLGYTTLAVRGTATAPATPARAVPSRIFNGTVSVAIDPVSHLPAGLESERMRAAFPNPRFIVVADREDTWGSGGLSSEPRFGTFDLVSSRVTEAGPLRWSLHSSYTFRSSRLEVTTILLAGEPGVRLQVESEWNEPFARAAFAIGLGGKNALYEIPFGIVERAASFALAPALRYVARRVTGGVLGLATIGDHGFWTSTTSTGVTIARATPYSMLGDVPPGAREFLDRGRMRHDLLLALVPDAPALAAAVDRFSSTFPVLWNGVHEGTLGAAASICTASPGISIASVRRIDDAIELRANDRSGKRNAAHVTLGKAIAEAPLSPFGIATWRITDARVETLAHT